MVFLTRSDPARKLNRFYIVRLAPTLFGEWTLLREWGRSGSPGTVRLTSFDCHDAAQKAGQCSIKRRLRHGYSERVP
jgi:predicted DNA-binding WGR domain protein